MPRLYKRVSFPFSFSPFSLRCLYSRGGRLHHATQSELAFLTRIAQRMVRVLLAKLEAKLVICFPVPSRTRTDDTIIQIHSGSEPGREPGRYRNDPFEKNKPSAAACGTVNWCQMGWELMHDGRAFSLGGAAVHLHSISIQYLARWDCSNM